MELRHLRYFVAVAEAGSLTEAAERRLYTSQPSLSRQLKDLEAEVGTPLFLRGSRGVALTPAGKVFLDHARLTLAQAQQAIAAARRTARPGKATFAVGFLTGQEVEWLRHVTRVLSDELRTTDFRVTSDFSPAIAAAVQSGDIDLGFSRIEPQPDVTYKVIAHEPIVVVLPREHPMASCTQIDPRDIDAQSFIGYSNTPHVLRGIVETYFSERGLAMAPSHFLDGYATGISLVASTKGITLLPAYVEALLPASLVSRPLAGNGPVIEVAAGYRADNPSPVLAAFLRNVDRLIAAHEADAGG